MNLIAAALAKAQAVFVQPEKNKTVEVKNDQGRVLYTFDYADYNAIVEAVRGPLSENGIAFTHLLEQNGAKWELVTMLIHTSGQVLECVWPIANVSDPKQIGGSMTYGKRYCLSAITGCVADDDLDAEPQNVSNFQDRKPPANARPNSAKPPISQQPGGAPKPAVKPNPPPATKPEAPEERGAFHDAPSGRVVDERNDAPEMGGEAGIPSDREPDLRPVTTAQTVRLWSIARADNALRKAWTEDQLKAFIGHKFKLGSTRALNMDQYDELVAILETKAFGPAYAAAIGSRV